MGRMCVFVEERGRARGCFLGWHERASESERAPTWRGAVAGCFLASRKTARSLLGHTLYKTALNRSAALNISSRARPSPRNPKKQQMAFRRKAPRLLLTLLPSPSAAPLAQARACASQASAPSSSSTTKRLNHVAIAVPNLERAAQRWRELAGNAAVSWPPQAVPAHGVLVVFVTLANVKIELLGALGGGAKSPIASFLEKHKRGGIHHLCLEVDDATAALEAARARGQRTLTDTPSPGAHGTPVGFLHPADFDGCLLEVEEVKGGD